MLAPARVLNPLTALVALLSATGQATISWTLRKLERELDALLLEAASNGWLRRCYLGSFDIAQPFSGMTVNHAKRMVIYQLLGAGIAAHALLQTPNIYWSVALAVSVAAPLAITFRHLRATSALRRLIKAGRLKDARPSLEERLRAMTDPIASEMGLEVRFRFLVAVENGALFPSVTHAGGVAQIVLPLGFLTVVRSHPARAQAMIAHELGHVKQRDTDLWHFAESAGRWSQVAVVASCTFQYVGAVAYDKPWIGLSALTLAVNALAFMQMTRRGRRLAEKLADVAAVVYGDSRAYFDALHEYSSYDHSEAHGPRAERLDRIAKLVHHQGGSR